jgi:hypothetical protein
MNSTRIVVNSFACAAPDQEVIYLLTGNIVTCLIGFIGLLLATTCFSSFWLSFAPSVVSVLMRDVPGSELDAIFVRLMYGSELNIVIERRISMSATNGLCAD